MRLPSAHEDSESCRGRRNDDRDRERRVVELCADADDRARREEAEQWRDRDRPGPPDQVRKGTSHCKKDDEAHSCTLAKRG